MNELDRLIVQLSELAARIEKMCGYLDFESLARDMQFQAGYEAARKAILCGHVRPRRIRKRQGDPDLKVIR